MKKKFIVLNEKTVGHFIDLLTKICTEKYLLQMQVLDVNGGNTPCKSSKTLEEGKISLASTCAGVIVSSDNFFELFQFPLKKIVDGFEFKSQVTYKVLDHKTLQITEQCLNNNERFFNKVFTVMQIEKATKSEMTKARRQRIAEKRWSRNHRSNFYDQFGHEVFEDL